MSKTVLIAEDQPSNLRLMRHVLRGAGYVTLEAKDGVEAIELAREHGPDLILMDLRMPRLDGIEATDILRADPATQHIPIVAVTAQAMTSDREKALAAGCVLHIAKPFDIRELKRTVRELLVE